MSHGDYLPRPKPPQDYEDASAAAEKRDMASKFGGTYLPPGKLYRDPNEISSSNAKESLMKKLLDDAERDDHRKSFEIMTKGAVDMRSMSMQDRLLTSAKMNPLVPLGLLGSILTLFVGVRSAYKGQTNKSYRLMNVRFGFGVVTVVALFGWQHLQKRIFQDRLRALKKELLEELGEDESSLNVQ
ncbi:uncharacterized protein LOC117338850 [Pecten maximus]|uniref:uncharacterized protein LOC117338850 n=1 Tax=Pecten maximus TaxID=6579 RepID=UPI001458C998|nr:uncharacterized protein LOC117338850 [Pecten maximus]